MIDKNIVKFVEMFDFMDKAVKLAQDNLIDWSIIYDLLFGEFYSKMQSIHHIDYYDPDTTYEEDVLAYYNAAKPIAEMFRKLAKGDF